MRWRGASRVVIGRGAIPSIVMVVLALVPLLSIPAAVEGQESLAEIEERVASGDVGQARDLLSEWIEERFDGAPVRERQQALWLRGRLSASVDAARRDYLRLVVEHPGGPHSADALLRLAQADAAEGDWDGAAGYYQQLLREYPESPHRLEARRWLDENRSSVAAESSEPEEPPQPAVSAEPVAPPQPSGSVSVQLGAFSAVDRAMALLGRVEDAGIEDIRLVRTEGTDLVRVRAGRFRSEEAAASLRDRIGSLGFDAVIVTDADRESRIR